MHLVNAVRAAYAAGLCLLPVAADGSKRPDTPDGWRVFQTRRPTAEEMRKFDFAHRDGFGVVGGAVSGGVEPWDFDDCHAFDAFVATAGVAGLGDLVAKIREGYEDQTPNGGRRWLVRAEPSVTFQDSVLARRPGRDGEPKTKTLIEITTFSILAPSAGPTHPSGRPYTRVSGGFDSIYAYSEQEREALIELARSFDQMPRPLHQASPSATRQKQGSELRPGADFDERTTWPDLLEPLGWVLVHAADGVSNWRRPGKSYGVSATTNYGGGDLLHVFSSSTEFDVDKSYSKFGVYAVTQHGGDFRKAALALSRRGYGAGSREPAASEASAGTAPRLLTPSKSGKRTLQLTPASEITPRPVRWLWQDRVALGTLALLGGREGVGKTIVAYTLAASVTKGTLPGACVGTGRPVIVAATEDSWEHTIVPRLMAAGADLTKVFRVDVVTSDGADAALSLPGDLQELSRLVRQVGAALIILDPLLSRLDAALDTHKDAEVRTALEPLVSLAGSTDACVLGLIHVNKSASSDVLNVLMGSRAFTAVARSVVFVMVDPDDEKRRLLGQAKNNLGRTDLPTLAFCIVGTQVATTTEGEIWTGKLDWLGETDRSIRDAVVAAADGPVNQTVAEEAAGWLHDFLTSQGGVCDCARVVQEGRRAGHSKNALHRARRRLGGVSEGRGFPRKSYWRLPLFPSRPALGRAGTTGSAGTTEGKDELEGNFGEGVQQAAVPVSPVVPVPGTDPSAASQERCSPATGAPGNEADDEHLGDDDARRF